MCESGSTKTVRVTQFPAHQDKKIQNFEQEGQECPLGHHQISVSISHVRIYATNFVGVFAAASVVLPELAPATCMANTPPNGPAGLGFAILTKQTFDWPPTVPEHVVPAGICTVKGYGDSVSYFFILVEIQEEKRVQHT